MATLLCVAMAATLCSMATADTGYSRGCTYGCDGSEVSYSSWGVKTGWYSDARVSDGTCAYTGCLYRTKGYTGGSCTYKPNLTYSGWYRLQTTWAGVSSNAKVVRYTIYHKDGPSLYNDMNQSINGEQWNDLNGGGALQFDSGGDNNNCRVVVTHPTVESGSGNALADSIKWIWVHPNDPTGLIVIRESETQIDLFWDATSMPGDGYYVIERKDGVEGTYAQIATGVVGTTYQDTTVGSGTTYYYRILAHETGDSGYSNEASTTPDPPSDPTPADNATSILTDATLSWVDNMALAGTMSTSERTTLR